MRDTTCSIILLSQLDLVCKKLDLINNSPARWPEPILPEKSVGLVGTSIPQIRIFRPKPELGPKTPHQIYGCGH